MMERRQQWIALCICVFLWYYASALSATSSQSYVKNLKSSLEVVVVVGDGEGGVGITLLAMVVVTFLQMVSGVFLGLMLGSGILRSTLGGKGESNSAATSTMLVRTYNRFLSSPSSKHTTTKTLFQAVGAMLGFPALHAAGSLFTNFGYACSSASFVQMIKLTEPIQTVILDIILRKLYSVPRQKIKVSITCFLLGASLVFLSRNNPSTTTSLSSSKNNPTTTTTTFWAIITVLLSGFFLSSRNVMKKIIHYKESSTTKNIHTSTETSSSSVTTKLLEGVEDFIHLSLGGALVLLPVLIVLLLILLLRMIPLGNSNTASRGGLKLVIKHLIPSTSPYLTMVLSHSIYNVASLSVLSFVAAPVHSLLNSGKRLSSTLFAMFWFGENLTASMVSGFILIFAGAAPFSKERQRALFLFVALGISGLYHSFVMQLRLSAINTAATTTLVPKSILRSSNNILGTSFFFNNAFQKGEPTRNHCKVQFIENDMRICHVSSKFGLELGPAIILKLLEHKFQCSIDEIPIHNISYIGRDPNIRCLFSVGSTFHLIQSGDYAWGTGINPFGQDWSKPRPRNVTFYSVRGPKTAALVQEKFNISQGALDFGEPAFLISSLYSLSAHNQQRHARQSVKVKTPPGRLGLQTIKDSEKEQICFVSRPQDLSYAKSLPLSPANIISTNHPWRSVAEFIKSCNYVASSSLYGIVIADAMGIPSLWFQFLGSNTSKTEGTFKYQDYYQAIGRPNNKSPVTNSSYIFDINYYDPIVSERNRDEIIKKSLASFPYQLFSTTTTTHVKSNRTLVIIMGTLRGGEASWGSMYRNLLDPNSADLALLVPKKTSRISSLFNRATFVWEHDEYDDWGIAIEKYIVGSNRTNWRQMVIPRNCLAKTWAKSRTSGLFGGVKEHTKCKCLEVKLKRVPPKTHSCHKDTNGSGAIIFLLRVILQENIRRLGLLEKYDRFVLTRSDHYYGCPHNLDHLDNRYMWIPSGEDYHGVTDRHLVCNSSHILKALNILPPVVLNPAKYWNFVDDGNPERLIKLRWVEEGLWDRVRRFPRMMFTCATRNDTSRWFRANFSSGMVEEGVYLKYSKEYTMTKANCNGTKNHFTGEDCNICNSII